MSPQILPRWLRPTDRILEGAYPSGKPPFDPFPTVTEMTNAYLCPRAIYHYLLHGEDGAFTPHTTAEGWKAGDTFHKFVDHLKTSIAQGSLNLGSQKDDTGKLYQIWSLFMDFAANLDKREIIWSEYVKPWAENNLNDLVAMRPGHRTLFEITVSSEHIGFATEGGGNRTYPLTGRIDEIDIDNKKIIERTIKQTATCKDFQVWLLWKTLTAIPRDRYPEAWNDVDFSEFELWVETPQENFPVTKVNPDFERRAHDCYAWIHNLTFDPLAVWEAYTESFRICTLENKNADCGLSWMCFLHKQQFPLGRNEMRRKFKDMYRALLWDKMWSADLLQYKFVRRNEEELEEWGLVCRGRVIPGTSNDNAFQVTLPSAQANLISAKATDESSNFLIVFGNMSIGQRLKATLENRGQDVFSITIEDNDGFAILGDPLIATVGEDLLVFEERPTYLITGIQRNVHRLEYRGIKDELRAKEDSKIQLIEGVFGRKRIKKARS